MTLAKCYAGKIHQRTGAYLSLGVVGVGKGWGSGVGQDSGILRPDVRVLYCSWLRLVQMR